MRYDSYGTISCTYILQSLYSHIKHIIIKRSEAFINKHDIEVDGGVSASNAKVLSDAGATMLVAGSSVFKAEDSAMAIAEMRV